VVIYLQYWNAMRFSELLYIKYVKCSVSFCFLMAVLCLKQIFIYVTFAVFVLPKIVFHGTGGTPQPPRLHLITDDGLE